MSVKFGTPTEEQLAKINSFAKRTLSADEVFCFPNKLAGDMIIPDRYIKLSKELLEVFMANAKSGVSLLLDHSWCPDGFFGLGGRPKAAIPYGRTFDARLEVSDVEGETVALNADHYMLRGVEIDGISTDNLIQSIEAGTLFDTSIGFNFSKGTCSVCNKEYYSSDCRHFAGRTYEVEGEDGVIRNVLCYVTAKPPGALWENSFVFDGAYPTAGVLSKAGEIIENQNGIFEVVTELKGIDPAKQLVATYSNRAGITTFVKKSDHKKIYSMDNGKSKEGGKMNEEVLAILTTFGIEVEEGKTLSVEEIKTLLTEKFKESIPLTGIEETPEYLSKEKATEALGNEMSADEVLKFAKEGVAYHKQVVEEAIAMGVKAMGNDFPAETWKNTFATMGTVAIKDIAKTWETQAQNSISTGRLTEPKGEGEKQADYPDEAFKVGK